MPSTIYTAVRAVTIKTGSVPMIDGERRRVRLAVGHSQQRNIAVALGCVQIEVFQSLGALPILRSDFQHHVILIQLRVDHRHFRLAECAVERRIQ
jgi:hypothetical protein